MIAETKRLAASAADYALTAQVVLTAVAYVAARIMPTAWAGGVAAVCLCIGLFVFLSLVGHTERGCARCHGRYGPRGYR